jgi:hypothetical protein
MMVAALRFGFRHHLRLMVTTSKWTAFLLSACVPGTGQLAARSVTCLAWFAAAGLLVAGGTWVQQSANGASWPVLLQLAAGVALSLLSAEHAKRLCECSRNTQGKALSAKVTCAAAKGRAIDMLISLDVASSTAALWQTVRDLPRFLTIDPFHDQVTLMRDEPAAGVDLVLSHNALGWRFLRFGRIVAWRENVGYTFSDLSQRGPQTGFPHVFIVKIEECLRKPMTGPKETSRLTIQIRGQWTSRLAPVWLGRAWVWLVCREHARLLRKGL